MFTIYVQPRIFVYSGKGLRSFSFNTLIIWPNHLQAMAETVYRVSAEGGLKGKSFVSLASSQIQYQMLARQCQFLSPSGNVTAIPTNAYLKVPWPDKLTVSIY